jgi:hypothetical protein
MMQETSLSMQPLLQSKAWSINCRVIFKDEACRRIFSDRLTINVEETGTRCFAWTLIPTFLPPAENTGARVHAIC